MTNQKALTRKSTSTNTETQDNQFEGRGFAVQKKSDTHTQKSDLNTLLLQAKTYGHSISQLAGQESSSASPQTNGLSIQAKLSIGEPGDRYEIEADRVASQVVQRINVPSSTGESVQREAMPEEDELQMKPLADSIQRVDIDDEEELQMKSLADSIQRVDIDDEEELQMKSQVQRREAIGGGEASTDLESSINNARGGGVAIADNIRQPMEQAFGADFSGVKVHTDGQSDQLNRSIQARAFTTGQDVFFRQGEYNPGSRGGQELLAHELTHVVQQNGGAVQRSPQPSVNENEKYDVLQFDDWTQHYEWLLKKHVKLPSEIHLKVDYISRYVNNSATGVKAMYMSPSQKGMTKLGSKWANETSQGGILLDKVYVEELANLSKNERVATLLSTIRHELQHAENLKQGIVKQDTSDANVDMDEVIAHSENILNKQLEGQKSDAPLWDMIEHIMLAKEYYDKGAGADEEIKSKAKAAMEEAEKKLRSLLRQYGNADKIWEQYLDEIDFSENRNDIKIKSEAIKNAIKAEMSRSEESSEESDV